MNGIKLSSIETIDSHFYSLKATPVGVGSSIAMPLRRRTTRRICLGIVSAFLFGLTGGCVERTVTINTDPDGATVILNDQEVGQTPIKVPFTWYGDYDIIIRKQGYQTIQTHRRIRTPWYQWPVMDFVSEVMMPFTIHDDRVLDTIVLETYQAPNEEELLGRAGELRDQVLSEQTE